MTINNTVTLAGNIGKEPRIIEDVKNPFAAFSLATTDTYKDKEGNWQDKETVWHEVITFSHKLIEKAKALGTKDRIQVTGSLTYRFFDAVVGEGKTVKKKEATIVARKIEDAPLVGQGPS